MTEGSILYFLSLCTTFCHSVQPSVILYYLLSFCTTFCLSVLYLLSFCTIPSVTLYYLLSLCITFCHSVLPSVILYYLLSLFLYKIMWNVWSILVSHHNIAEILLKLVLNTNQSIHQSYFSLI
jgi:hypothetical protein